MYDFNRDTSYIGMFLLDFQVYPSGAADFKMNHQRPMGTYHDFPGRPFVLRPGEKWQAEVDIQHWYPHLKSDIKYSARAVWDREPLMKATSEKEVSDLGKIISNIIEFEVKD
jgi:hypothetical protein